MSDSTPGSTNARRPRSEQIKQIVGTAAIVLIALFAVLNTQTVTIHWIVTTTHTPLIVALLLAAVLGALGGFGFSQLRRRRR